jgi:hypothetical protein
MKEYSNKLLDFLCPVLHDYLPNNTMFEETFDLFEYLLALIYLDFANRYLFNWNDILGIDFDRFIEFLKNRYNIGNISREKIKKVDDSTISISNGENSLKLKLNNKKTALEIEGCRTDKLLADEENGKLNIYLDITWSPDGRFGWRFFGNRGKWEGSPIGEFVSNGLKQGSNWDLIKAGFFNGSIERFKKIVELHKKLSQNYNRSWI